MDMMGPAQARGPAIPCIGLILYILFIHVKKVLAASGCGTAAQCDCTCMSKLGQLRSTIVSQYFIVGRVPAVRSFLDWSVGQASLPAILSESVRP